MIKGIRKLKVAGGGQFYIVKNKRWDIHRLAIWNRRGNVFLIINPKFARNWHKDKLKKAHVLHELGHRYGIKIHFINELVASFYGYYKYKRLCPEVKLWHVFLSIVESSNYMFHLKSPFKK